MGAGIRIENVSKTFVLRHNRNLTLKSAIIGLFHKRYREIHEPFDALRDVSFTIAPGESMALIGRNGAGKSTLLRIIAGVFAPTAGRVLIDGHARIGTMIELGVGFNPELTGRENVFLNASIYGLTRREITRIFPAVVEFAELAHFMDVPLKNYSSGMHARLAFSIIAQFDPDVVLLDEVLAVGDEAFQAKCRGRIERFRRDGKTIVFVSHSLSAVRDVCDRACLLQQGRLLTVGPVDDVITAYHATLPAPDTSGGPPADSQEISPARVPSPSVLGFAPARFAAWVAASLPAPTACVLDIECPDLASRSELREMLGASGRYEISGPEPAFAANVVFDAVMWEGLFARHPMHDIIPNLVRAARCLALDGRLFALVRPAPSVVTPEPISHADGCTTFAAIAPFHYARETVDALAALAGFRVARWVAESNVAFVEFVRVG